MRSSTKRDLFHIIPALLIAALVGLGTYLSKEADLKGRATGIIAQDFAPLSTFVASICQDVTSVTAEGHNQFSCTDLSGVKIVVSPAEGYLTQNEHGLYIAQTPPNGKNIPIRGKDYLPLERNDFYAENSPKVGQNF